MSLLKKSVVALVALAVIRKYNGASPDFKKSLVAFIRKMIKEFSALCGFGAALKNKRTAQLLITEGMVDKQTEVRSVKVVDATPENFAPYGTILGDTVSGGGSNHYAATRVVNCSPNYFSDEDSCVLILCYEPRPVLCRYMERHYKHSQVFVPLEGKPLIGFFAVPNDKEEPDLDKVVAFRFSGNAGFVMHKGTWHEQPFPLEPATKAVCILRKETVKELKPTDPATGECHGNDIDKLNLEARHKVVFTAEVCP